MYILAKNYCEKPVYNINSKKRKGLNNDWASLDPNMVTLIKIYPDMVQKTTRINDQLLLDKNHDIKEIFKHISLISVSCNDEFIATCQSNSALIRTWNTNIDLVYVFDMSADSNYNY